MGEKTIENVVILEQAIAVMNERLSFYMTQFSQAYAIEQSEQVFYWSEQMTRCNDILLHLGQEVTAMTNGARK